MRKNFKKLAIALAVVMGLTVTYTAMANPGSDSDPVISLSYLKEIFKPEVKEELSFRVVSVPKGMVLTAHSGTELILRMGTATIISTQSGGLADVTQGVDLQNGSKMPANHQLITPKDDGRGIVADTDCLVMVKGDYEITE